MPIFGGRDTEMSDAVKDSQTEVLEETQKGRERLSHKILDALDGGEHKKREEEEDRQRTDKLKEEARHNVEAQRGLGSQIHDLLDGGRCRTALEQVEFERLEAQALEERKKRGDISDKLHDALGAPSELQQKVRELIHHDEQAQQQKVEQNRHIGDKVKEILHGAPEGSLEPKQHHALWASRDEDIKQLEKEGWVDKLHMLSRKEEPPQEGWIQETIHGIAGNDQKKKKEDEYKNLNRAIDFVQEHVLHQDD